MFSMADDGTSSFIGVAICIGANSLISVALNVQKLAHMGLEKAQRDAHRASRPSSASPSRTTAHSSLHPQIQAQPDERTHLLTPTLEEPSNDTSQDPRSTRSPAKQVVTIKAHRSSSVSSARSGRSVRSLRPRVDKAYLTSPMWWLGIALLNLGELGNFTAYAFAPASLIAPLGTVALVSNVFLQRVFPPKNAVRGSDLWGCFLAVIGGITVVQGSKSSDKKLNPDQMLVAVSQPLFIAYALTSVVTMVVLAYFSQTRYGDKHVMIDLTLCALAGGLTVLSTKAFSSFLNLMFLDAFKHWITYPILATLIATALIQINFVNKSLQRFDSRVVIPSQFCSFALSCIVGSAVLYREFEGVDPSQMIQFVLGCLISAGGVYVLTKDPSDDSSSNSNSNSTGQDGDLPKPATASVRPTTANSATSNAPSALTLELPPGISANSLRVRKLSVTLGGAQYLLARSPEATSALGGGRGRHEGGSGTISRSVSGGRSVWSDGGGGGQIQTQLTQQTGPGAGSVVPVHVVEVSPEEEREEEGSGGSGEGSIVERREEEDGQH